MTPFQKIGNLKGSILEKSDELIGREFEDPDEVETKRNFNFQMITRDFEYSRDEEFGYERD